MNDSSQQATAIRASVHASRRVVWHAAASQSSSADRGGSEQWREQQQHSRRTRMGRDHGRARTGNGPLEWVGHDRVLERVRGEGWILDDRQLERLRYRARAARLCFCSRVEADGPLLDRFERLDWRPPAVDCRRGPNVNRLAL